MEQIKKTVFNSTCKNVNRNCFDIKEHHHSHHGQANSTFLHTECDLSNCSGARKKCNHG